MSEALPLNLLVAYPYMSQGTIETIRRNQGRVRFLLDSGAFTAWKSGKQITLDAYCSFLEKLPFKPWRYFMLDVVGNPEATLRNYELMRQRGFSPMPIFTRGEDPTILDEYFKTSDVVGLGGIGNKEYVKGIMRRVNGRSVHWLGFTNLNWIKHYKPYMCDSSTWETGARYGQIPLYIGQGHKPMSIKRTKIQTHLKDPIVADAIRRCGFEPNDLLKGENWRGGMSVSRRLGARSYVKLSQDVYRNTGTHLFLAAATDYAVKLILDWGMPKDG